IRLLHLPGRAREDDMGRSRLRPILIVTGVVIALVGIVIAGLGAWLIALGGTWYYVQAGLGFILTAFMLLTGRPAALWVYAIVVAGTLAWALWEVGLDWWQLAPRGWLIVLIGLFLATPWIGRALAESRRD